MPSGIWLSSITTKLQNFLCDHLVIFAHSKISVWKRLHWNRVTLLSWWCESDTNFVNIKSVWFIHRVFWCFLVKHLLLMLPPWASKHCRWSGIISHSERSQDWQVKLHSAIKCMHDSWRWTLQASANLFILFKSRRTFCVTLQNMMRLSFCKHSVNVRNDYMVTQEI